MAKVKQLVPPMLEKFHKGPYSQTGIDQLHCP